MGSKLSSLSNRLQRLERDTTGKVVIVQRDGTVLRFSDEDAMDALKQNLLFLRAKAEGSAEFPELTPFQRAALNALDSDKYTAFIGFVHYGTAERATELS